MERIDVGLTEAMMPILRVVDHAAAPGGRFKRDGPNSGEWFRDDVLLPRLQHAAGPEDPLVVVLDGAPGYGSSFLEEAFGGLVRLGVFTPGEVRERLIVRADSSLYAPYQRLAERYMTAAMLDQATV